jgi:hypothetical protein
MNTSFQVLITDLLPSYEGLEIEADMMDLISGDFCALRIDEVQNSKVYILLHLSAPHPQMPIPKSVKISIRNTDFAWTKYLELDGREFRAP